MLWVVTGGDWFFLHDSLFIYFDCMVDLPGPNVTDFTLTNDERRGREGGRLGWREERRRKRRIRRGRRRIRGKNFRKGDKVGGEK